MHRHGLAAAASVAVLAAFFVCSVAAGVRDEEMNYIRVSRDFKDVHPGEEEQAPVFYARVTKKSGARPPRAFYARVSRSGDDDDSFVRVTKSGNNNGRFEGEVDPGMLLQRLQQQQQQRGEAGNQEVDGRKVEYICSRDAEDGYWFLRRVFCDQLLGRRRRAEVGGKFDPTDPFLVLRKYA